jgi:CRP-like cAMP-binding protein
MPPAAPSSVRPGLPKSIDAIVLRVLGKRPEHRYATWAEFALDLSDAVKLVLPPEAIPDSEKYVALKRVEMLSGLSDSELWELAHAGHWYRKGARTAIIVENESGNSFFFLAQGQVKVTRQGRLLNMIDERECFGEMAYIRGGQLPRHATVETMNPVLLAEFQPAALEKMSVEAQLHLTRALVRNLVDRLELANSRLK